MKIFRWIIIVLNLAAMLALVFFVVNKISMLFFVQMTMSGTVLVCLFFDKLKHNMFGKVTAVCNLLLGLLFSFLLTSIIFPSLLGDGCPFANIRSDKTLFTAVWVYLFLGGAFYLANAVFLFIPDKKDMIPRFEENQSS